MRILRIELPALNCTGRYLASRPRGLIQRDASPKYGNALQILSHYRGDSMLLDQRRKHLRRRTRPIKDFALISIVMKIETKFCVRHLDLTKYN